VHAVLPISPYRHAHGATKRLSDRLPPNPATLDCAEPLAGLPQDLRQSPVGAIGRSFRLLFVLAFASSALLPR